VQRSSATAVPFSTYRNGWRRALEALAVRQRQPVGVVNDARGGKLRRLLASAGRGAISPEPAVRQAAASSPTSSRDGSTTLFLPWNTSRGTLGRSLEHDPGRDGQAGVAPGISGR